METHGTAVITDASSGTGAVYADGLAKRGDKLSRKTAAPRYRVLTGRTRKERSDVAGGIDHDRRRFLGTAAMTIAAAHLGTFGTVAADRRRAT